MSETETADKKEEVKLVFPSLENGPLNLYDSDSGNFWAGVPLRSVGPDFAKEYFESLRPAITLRWGAILNEANKSKILKPSVGTKIKEGIGAMMSRISGR